MPITQDELDEKLKELKTLREKANTLSRTKDRLTGELETRQKRLDELEKESKEKFGCAVKGLPAKVESLAQEATKLIEEAESILSEEDEEDDDSE